MMNIDLNADLGEGMPNDSLIMPFISSANIACGYHAGDADLMQRTVELCLQYGTAIGAHPGFNDKPDFGRTEMELSENELYDLMADQLYALTEICRQHGTTLHHVKPHGALYTMAAQKKQMSHVLARAVKEFNPALIFYGLSGSCMIEEAGLLGLATAREAFADRTYQDNGLLTPRSVPGSVIEDPSYAAAQVMQILQQRCVTTTSKKIIPLDADTVCLHGDNFHAVEFSKLLNRELKSSGIIVKPV